MKKEYTTPVIEKIAFDYRDQVVVASNAGSGGSGNIETPNTPDYPNTTPSTPSLSDVINGIINIVTDRSSYVNWC